MWAQICFCTQLSSAKMDCFEQNMSLNAVRKAVSGLADNSSVCSASEVGFLIPMEGIVVKWFWPEEQFHYSSVDLQPFPRRGLLHELRSRLSGCIFAPIPTPVTLWVWRGGLYDVIWFVRVGVVYNHHLRVNYLAVFFFMTVWRNLLDGII